ncbi:spore germination protein [Lysinibacillus sp. BW-2-10]|uniref:spore germination protein n=1 Tax=Lysinibacillus sp. BW-2-10 TaxID=2590030 RepID=UPI001180522D|nr:spore germination protein [Lysinibacillus sp. BW-2-10]TSI09672.1 spore germination protein [Lysinibacillus sp. BW-2-10]
MFNKKKKEKQQKQQNEQQQKESKKEPKKEPISSNRYEFLQSVKEKLHSSSDLIIRYVSPTITVIYVDNLVDVSLLNDQVLEEVQNAKQGITPQELHTVLKLPEVDVLDELNKTILEMLIGAAIIHFDGYSEVVITKISSYQSRGLSAPENESQVVGSQVGFNESIATNISLIRRYITNPDLVNEKFTLGKQTNTSLSLLYIHGLAAEQHVNTIRQRISDLELEDILDSAVLAGLIDDSALSIFPQMLLTERPDRFCDGLLSGKVGIVLNGSSMAILCPQSFIEFFQSREDQNLRWPIASFVRLLRFIAIFISIYLTPIYVATLTYHYEVIPQPLLIPLNESRAIVPFPPIIEAILLEIIIELLREAGAKLPTKVGQTIGIVGGIVIGTAAVQAGITSNILIIIVALGALSSFTTPNYMMGNAIRIIRFPIIILAGFWGYYGIMLATCLLLAHLLRQSTLGAPYLAPFYPPRWTDWPDSIIRLPLPFLTRSGVNSRKPQKKNAQQDKKKVTE